MRSSIDTIFDDLAGFVPDDDATFGADGLLYVTEGVSDTVFRIDVNSPEILGAFTPAFNVPSGGEYLTFGPDGNLYVSTGADGTIYRFDGTTGSLIDEFAVLVGHTAEQVAFGPDGDLYVASGSPAVVARIDGETGEPLGVFTSGYPSGDNHRFSGIAFGPDGNLYVGDHYNGSVVPFDGVTGEFIDVFAEPGGFIGALKFTPEPGSLALLAAGAMALSRRRR